MLGEKTVIKVNFPDLSSAKRHEEAQSLLSELKQDPDLHSQLDIDKSGVERTNKEAMDFGATLIIVLGTPAVMSLAKTVRSWCERRGRTTIELNGVRIDNVYSHDTANIIKALQSKR